MGMAGNDIKEKMDKRLSDLLAEIALSIVYLWNNLMVTQSYSIRKRAWIMEQVMHVQHERPDCYDC